MRKSIIASAIAGMVLFAGSAAAAQDMSASPAFGEVRLRTGFNNDPYTVSLIAGGSENGGRLPGACVGQIGDAPDYRLHYSGDGSLPLFIRTISRADTTLIINGPDGQWHCDDDSYGDGDAQVRFGRPRAGVYDIWVGAFDGNPEATLVITEME